jgi:hypothetical protein
MNTKYICHSHPHSLFPYAHPSLCTLPLEKTCFTPYPSFFFFFFLKCMLWLVQGSFALVFQGCIHHALIKLTLPPLLTHYQYHHALLIFNSLQYSTLLYLYIDGLFQSSSFFNIFFPSPTSHRPLRQTHK